MSLRSFARNIRTQYRIFKHKGNTYTCPYCGYHAIGFYQIGLPHQANIDHQIIGAGLRNGGCYKCDSMDRERALYAFFNNELDIFKNKSDYSILHLAPEWRLTDLFLKYQYKEYICTDKFMEGYSYPSHVIDMDIMNIPYEDNRFDLIICNHILEHIPDDIAAMKELFRVLKPNGTAVLQVPISATLQDTYENPAVTTNEDREKHYGQYDHVRIYGQDYVARLQSVGFKVNRINISNKYKQYGLIPNEDLFICSK